jgi:hypothetical protein
VVTAAHVIRTFAYTAIRLGLRDGGVIDHPIATSEWRIHPYEDVAVTLLRDIDAEAVEVAVCLRPPATFLGGSAQPPTGPNPEGNPALEAASLAARASQPTGPSEAEPEGDSKNEVTRC